MNNLIFLPIQKIDMEQRLVYGRACQEVPDRTGKTPEIMDYSSSKPFFQKWSEEQLKASQGKSYGNVRVMHNKVAAGLLPEPLDFNDREKAIDVCAKIVDDDEWQKCVTGVYTGFSVGGSYVSGSKKYELLGDEQVMRYTADPSELSLVDRPSIPTSTFQMIKADGTVEERVFKVAAREDVNPEEGKKRYGDVKFADAKNKKYPIDTEAHIRAAWNYINKPKNAGKYSAADLKTIKNKIIAAWKAKIDKDGPPSAQIQKEDKPMTMKKIECYEDAIPILQKWAGEEISDVSDAVSALMQVVYLYRKEKDEDHPEAEAQMKTLADAIMALKAFIVSEIQEADEGDVINLAVSIGDLAKIQTGDLKKVGVAISKANAEKVQKIHDHTQALGAVCKCQKCDGTFKCDKCDGTEKHDHGDLKKLQDAHAEDLAKIQGELTTTKDSLEKIQGDLQKITGERDDALQKVQAVTAEKDRFEKVTTSFVKFHHGKDNLKIDEIEKLPAPTKVAVMPVQKGQGADGELPAPLTKAADEAAECLNKGDREGGALALIKGIHSMGPTTGR